MLTRALLILCLSAFALPAEAAICKTLTAAWVGFGEDSSRKEAEIRLDKEVSAWREKYKLASLKPRARKTACNIYIELLDEYECKAEAVVCR